MLSFRPLDIFLFIHKRLNRNGSAFLLALSRTFSSLAEITFFFPIIAETAHHIIALITAKIIHVAVLVEMLAVAETVFSVVSGCKNSSRHINNHILLLKIIKIKSAPTEADAQKCKLR